MSASDAAHQLQNVLGSSKQTGQKHLQAEPSVLQFAPGEHVSLEAIVNVAIGSILAVMNISVGPAILGRSTESLRIYGNDVLYSPPLGRCHLLISKGLPAKA